MPAVEGTVGQPDADAGVAIKVGRGPRSIVRLEIGRRADHRGALRPPQRDRDHVARHQIARTDAEVEPLGDDIDEPALGHEIDVYLRVAPDERQHERFEDLARASRIVVGAPEVPIGRYTEALWTRLAEREPERARRMASVSAWSPAVWAVTIALRSCLWAASARRRRRAIRAAA